MSEFPVFQCSHPECRLRYPAQAGHGNLSRCPKCGNPARLVESPQVDLQIRKQIEPANAPVVEAFLDNIRSTFNVGAMFRAADGAGVRQLHLAGITPLPSHPRVSKTSLGAERSVPWQHHPDGAQAIHQLKESGYQIWALEGGAQSESIFSINPHLSPAPLLLVVGNEVTGIDPAVLEHCDRRISIPMLGFKESLNVAIAFGIAIYTLRFQFQIF